MIGGVLGSLGAGELGRYLLQRALDTERSRAAQPNRASLPRYPKR